MKSAWPISVACPYCGTAMRVRTMECVSCGIEVQGRFRDSLFQLLTDEEQRFLEQYLLADFSIKELAAQTAMGYAAIRSRLDRLIADYRKLMMNEETQKRILEKVASGELSAGEAAERIRSLRDGRH